MVDSAVVARGIGVTGLWGPVYGPVDLDVPAGGVTVLLCPPGPGRTALLMTLAGRMKPERGTLTVMGRSRAREIFASSAIAGIEELDPVTESVTVRDLVTEQIRWNAKWYKLVRRATETDVRAVCGPTFGDVPLPQLNRYVDDIGELARTLLRVALANLNRPELLVVGSLDDVSADADRGLLLERLIALGQQQTVITSTVNPLPDDIGCVQVPVANTVPEAAQQKGVK